MYNYSSKTSRVAEGLYHFQSCWNKAVTQNLPKVLPKINCSIHFFIGKKDFQTNHVIAEEYFKHLKAPKEKIFLFEDAGHSVFMEKPEEIQKIIIEQILDKN
ncbi:alpha/beta fold hydrolase [Flavobacterium humidisoli]|uniref:Alpha/beta hydrolase n=1 Tax=Flavobacterium humidisoli TaxID=2937442 RepID=A0ABY4LNZ3_9FLAO|nr:alpha/beta hydrolase [Flavobacterium humidisoli]UPZ14809.1 alpha/beta hydrolase [Flavobacterium humidisoli]